MRPHTLGATAQINITPLIDVLLVLLVIFLAGRCDTATWLT
jgi:biopolymer transport protein ExbD